MKSKLTPDQIQIFHTRIHISRSLKLFKLEELAKNWEMCRMTLYRYDSPHYRNLSREGARKTTQLKKHDSTKCQTCFKPLKTHIRCFDCTMLQHGDPECSCKLIRDFLLEDSLH